MSLSMYKITVPAFIRGFSILSSLIDKAEAFAAEKKIDPAILFNARLAPDMLPFSGQIQRVSDTSKGVVARLTTIEAPRFPDDEADFSQLRDRIAKTVAFLESVDTSALDGSESKKVTLKFGKMEVTLSGEDYILKFVLPNFYFHVTTAQNILRHNGVPVGKLDYIGALS
ncbi:DUF1993 domain-containing protein [Phyllobacterium endophyticum]|uniref:DUF1993 domain-containing protein n=1 Tax=Phyllobacterium endophyticum TaxID=1149773 RepID=A0A2P7AVG4_9HYPH|nr:DUF1993 domain-containing protein [Phyllobacterium endophyticum]MBB3234735.1 hypothetical protein [Phyllobacterium endophyticum]PSH58187.1 DUF1993 domain-containing protein [Phyllobacterium endophyticum]TXR50773.1 DUF1993 domain-containing protein [Phyllobacterium endophyticum]TYR38864.1 DUF1993 domain-containing protein [Phyllobacterium endophyticum]